MLSDLALNTGLSFHWQGDLARAEAAYRKALELASDMLGTSHPRAWLFHLYIGTVLVDRGAWDAAAPELEAALAGFGGALGTDGELARHVRVQRARLRLGKGDLAGARADIDAVQASLIRTQSVDQPSPGYMHPLLVEGQIALAEGNLDAADAALRGGLDRLQRLYGPGSLELATPQIALAELALARGRPRDAIVTATAALAILRTGGSVENDPRRARALLAHAGALRAIDPSSREADTLAADAATIWDSIARGASAPGRDP
jgi:tetratricopeptide (TPR) repeat protein